jgi:hypothetical protein
MCSDVEPGQRRRIVMLVDNGVNGDSRVQKEARSAVEAGWEATLLGRSPDDDEHTWSRGPAQVRLLPTPFPLSKRPHQFRRRPRQDPGEGPSQGIELVWDAHEFLPRVRPWTDQVRWRLGHMAHEGEYVPYVDAAVTVSDELAGMLRETHGPAERPMVVLNTPAVDHAPNELTDGVPVDVPVADLRAMCEVGPDAPLLVYCGAAASQRGVLDRLHLVPYVPHWQVVPMVVSDVRTMSATVRATGQGRGVQGGGPRRLHPCRAGRSGRSGALPVRVRQAGPARRLDVGGPSTGFDVRVPPSARRPTAWWRVSRPSSLGCGEACVPWRRPPPCRRPPGRKHGPGALPTTVS